jgi:hypothetical protein
VAVRVPPFWAEGPAVWFAQVEAQFILAGISDERRNFYHTISQLEHRYAAEVEDIISPPQQDPFTKRPTELLYRNSEFGVLAADSQSTSSSGYRASLWDPRPDFILFLYFRLTITLFFFLRHSL